MCVGLFKLCHSLRNLRIYSIVSSVNLCWCMYFLNRLWGLRVVTHDEGAGFEVSTQIFFTSNKKHHLDFIDRIGGLFLIRFGYISIQGRAGVVRLWQGGNAALLWHLCDHHRSSRECDPWPRDCVTRGCHTFHCRSGLIDILSPLWALGLMMRRRHKQRSIAEL